MLEFLYYHHSNNLTVQALFVIQVFYICVKIKSITKWISDKVVQHTPSLFLWCSTKLMLRSQFSWMKGKLSISIQGACSNSNFKSSLWVFVFFPKLVSLPVYWRLSKKLIGWVFICLTFCQVFPKLTVLDTCQLSLCNTKKHLRCMNFKVLYLNMHFLLNSYFKSKALWLHTKRRLYIIYFFGNPNSFSFSFLVW